MAGTFQPRRDGHSSGTPVAGRLKQPTRATRPTDQAPLRPKAQRIAPIRSCSRRGLPCRRRCRQRGALLPHPFTLAVCVRLSACIRRFAFCGAFPRVTPAGRYPAPDPHGARTFLRFVSGGRPADWRKGDRRAAAYRSRTIRHRLRRLAEGYPTFFGASAASRRSCRSGPTRRRPPWREVDEFRKPCR